MDRTHALNQLVSDLRRQLREANKRLADIAIMATAATGAPAMLTPADLIKAILDRSDRTFDLSHLVTALRGEGIIPPGVKRGDLWVKRLLPDLDGYVAIFGNGTKTFYQFEAAK